MHAPLFLSALKRAVCDVRLMRMSGPRERRSLNRPLLLPTAMATHRERPGQSKPSSLFPRLGAGRRRRSRPKNRRGTHAPRPI